MRPDRIPSPARPPCIFKDFLRLEAQQHAILRMGSPQHFLVCGLRAYRNLKHTRGPLVERYSRRQLLANAAMAASRVSA
jgi:hypothetical protein